MAVLTVIINNVYSEEQLGEVILMNQSSIFIVKFLL